GLVEKWGAAHYEGMIFGRRCISEVLKFVVVAGLLASLVGEVSAAVNAGKPNIILIFADDLGYGDIGCYGSTNATPNLDRMAKEGVRFTDFCVAQPVCSASRAALMTGRYCNRVGVLGALPPKSKIVLATNEVTIAEVLKGRGYATAIYGKWHLGDGPDSLPRNHGFDEYYGLPYSNDMWPNHPVNPERYPPL